MFDVKKEVPSLELCRKLKELGYPQDKTGFWWGYRAHLKDDEQYVLLFGNEILVGELDWWKAPTLGEMEEVLSAKIDTLGDGSDWFLRIEKWGDRWYVDLSKFAYCVCSEKGEKLPNAYAKMLIWLAENGYLSFERKEANNA